MHSGFRPLSLALFLFVPACLSGAVGTFDGESDIGLTLPGSVQEVRSNTFLVTGGGANMWFAQDAFHFVWKRASGELSLASDLRFPAPGGNAHRKACLLIRQSLDPDSAYADVAMHGDGLTSLQFREAKGAKTQEIQCNVAGPKRVSIEKRGLYVTVSLIVSNEAIHPSGASARIAFTDPFYVGIGVCSHDSNVLEKAEFANLEWRFGPQTADRKQLVSTLETIPLSSRDRRVVYVTTNLIEAPNWSRDGSSLYFNSKGRIYRVKADGGEPHAIDTGFATRCNNDHGLSPDGTQLVISDQSQERRSLIYVLPATGGVPRRLTQSGPSYWHGWSPDGKTLAFCGERDGEFDIYTIPAAGGPEAKLTSSPGLDDAPDYSPDGNFIYFNSERSGTMQIWRMRSNGSGQEQVTADDYNNWFPHPSPDGKWLVFLSYDRNVKGHPENKNVMLRIIPLSGGKPEVLAKLFGGQGTINVPSWSPDSRKLAFVSYQAAATP